ncbi:MAG: hypothetical protein Q4D81_15200, partial [Eubacteriales bacterium]|nr:hypothetical protein [Eubacteriales bacterium]
AIWKFGYLEITDLCALPLFQNTAIKLPCLLMKTSIYILTKTSIFDIIIMKRKLVYHIMEGNLGNKDTFIKKRKGFSSEKEIKVPKNGGTGNENRRNEEQKKGAWNNFGGDFRFLRRSSQHGPENLQRCNEVSQEGDNRCDRFCIDGGKKY